VPNADMLCLRGSPPTSTLGPDDIREALL
jgi:hypothetical protein